MPFKSKAQRRLFWAKEQKGEIPKATVMEWEHATKNKNKLPEHVTKQGHFMRGKMQALASLGLLTGCTFTDSSTGKAVMDFLLQTLVLIVTPVLLMLIKRAIEELERRTGLAITRVHAAKINEAVIQGIAYAHEQGRKRLKLNEQSLTGTDKQNLAVDYVITMLNEYNVPEISRDYITKLIDAQLNLDRESIDRTRPPVITGNPALQGKP